MPSAASLVNAFVEIGIQRLYLVTIAEGEIDGHPHVAKSAPVIANTINSLRHLVHILDPLVPEVSFVRGGDVARSTADLRSVAAYNIENGLSGRRRVGRMLYAVLRYGLFIPVSVGARMQPDANRIEIRAVGVHEIATAYRGAFPPIVGKHHRLHPRRRPCNCLLIRHERLAEPPLALGIRLRHLFNRDSRQFAVVEIRLASCPIAVGTAKSQRNGICVPRNF